MAEAKSRAPRIRLPRVAMPSLGRGATTRTAAKPQAPAKAGESTAPAEKVPGQAAAAKTPPPPNVQERMEGLQGWMAEIERRQGRMTYFIAAAVLIAILASGAALYFGITAKNDSSSTMDDLDSLETKVDGLAQAVNQSTKETQDTINNSMSQLQSSIADLQKKQAKNAAKISTLQSQVQAGALNRPGAGAMNQGGAAAPTPAPAPAPGTTTTPGGNAKPQATPGALGAPASTRGAPPG